ncbi:MgtC/SapB family protein [Phenylobacterium sp. CCH12-B4]|uniref:MgtC/SapB family protein n=1 Tax=Phenylobacterium sp. CCH12-B4 TaxID=1768784 RepID=UPI000B1A9CBD|nr:MgtC/SapB family protein [Phenylobacterium sp. CCH12-B4]
MSDPTMLGDSPWFVDIGRIALAAVLGALIGWERERRGREAGIRTYMATALGACAFGLISAAIGDQGRISAGIVTGIGFIGAGIILRDAGRVTGLTTAATLWASAAVTSVLILAILELHRVPGWSRLSHRARAEALRTSLAGSAASDASPDSRIGPTPSSSSGVQLQGGSLPEDRLD